MKKILQLFILSIYSIGFLSSCGSDDEPAIDALVGTWELDEIVVADPPAAFSMQDGTEFASIYGESQYQITFNSDFTYEREVENTSQFGDLDDEGTWERNGDEITLEYDDGDEGLIPEEEFEILDDIDDKLKVSFGGSIFVLSDETLNDDEYKDTVTADNFNQILIENGVNVQVTLELEFDKQ